MIVYASTKSGFINDFEQGILIEKIYNLLAQKMKRTGRSEVASWQNSLSYMCNVMYDNKIPDEAGVAIEYIVPNTQKRVDFIVSGEDDKDKESIVVIELKQWNEANVVNGKDNIVETFVGSAMREVTHPSYQAWSYCQIIKDYNSGVQQNHIGLFPCAYLHNYKEQENDPLRNLIYSDIISCAPLFTLKEMGLLRQYICQHIVKRDKDNVLGKIENGRLMPAKSLQDSIPLMLAGNREFTLIDDQKVVYENIMYAAREAVLAQQKTVYIVQGGPGSGKSVVAINLLASMIQNGIMAQYVTRNAAPRTVYKEKLLESVKNKRKMKYSNNDKSSQSEPTLSRTSIDFLFKGSGSFIAAKDNAFKVLIVDEAHRLSEKSGMFYNQGENQIKEIIQAAQCSIFFIDDHQRVTLKDIGSTVEIRKFAEEAGAVIYEGALESQFRCNGSDGYIAWVDNLLDIRETANYDGFDDEYDFRVFDNPKDLQTAIEEKNNVNGKSRLVAGYCWEWPTKERNNTRYNDITIPEYDFGISWNLDGGQAFAMDKDSIHEAGCIHTTQGLEFDYVGVIIGDDLRFENGEIITDYSKRARGDTSLRGIKKMMKQEKESAEQLSDEIIKNTYRTLMTRGQKGCYIFCTDKALSAYITDRLRLKFSDSKETISKKIENTYYRKINMDTLIVADSKKKYNTEKEN